MPRFFSLLSAMVLALLLTSPISSRAAASPFRTTKFSREKGTRQIEGDARVLHLLNRLTFGPRPGDFATVKAMGIKQWVNWQLEPQTIDDSALESKLAAYPAMRMSVSDLIYRLPPRPVIRQVLKGRFSIPQSQPERAIYETQVALAKMRQQARAAKQSERTSPTPQSTSQSVQVSPADDAAADPQLAEKEKKIFGELQATTIVNLPPEQRMQKLFAMQPLERIGLYRSLSREDRIAFVQGLTPEQAQTFSAIMSPVRTVASQLEATKMLRAIESNRQLQQVMTDFWLNHFNVDIRKSPLMAYYLTQYESKVIEPNALGNFEELLVATARSSAMLLYLDNASSVGPHSQAAMRVESRNASADTQRKRSAPGLNENYGRELMELQTLGVGSGYTQQDVIEVAKAFTGWTIEKPLQGGGFQFNAARHEPGTKHVLGHVIPERGEDEGLEVLHILATSPATAQHISEELAERFVSDHPSQTLVDRMTKTFLQTHGDIRQVLRTMFFSPEFWAPGTINAKVKTPLELVASAARASNTQVQHPIVLALAVARLGMPLYDCQPPTGYSMNADAWVSSGSLVERMKFAVAFANNRLPGVTNDWDALLGSDSASMNLSQKESSLEELLLHCDISLRTHDAVIKELVNASAALEPLSFPLGKGIRQAYVVPIARSAAPSLSQQR